MIQYGLGLCWFRSDCGLRLLSLNRRVIAGSLQYLFFLFKIDLYKIATNTHSVHKIELV